eukprot:UN27871
MLSGCALEYLLESFIQSQGKRYYIAVVTVYPLIFIGGFTAPVTIWYCILGVIAVFCLHGSMSLPWNLRHLYYKTGDGSVYFRLDGVALGYLIYSVGLFAHHSAMGYAIAAVASRTFQQLELAAGAFV